MIITKMNTFTLMLCTVLCIGCGGGCGNIAIVNSISDNNKQLTVGKIYKVGYSGKNGATNFIYYINGVKYSGTSRFNTGEFKHGSMFLLYLDKTNPSMNDIVIPKVKILPITDGSDSVCMASLGINLEDFRLVSNDEDGPNYK